jgi:hypothetical protein
MTSGSGRLPSATRVISVGASTATAAPTGTCVAGAAAALAIHAALRGGAARRMPSVIAEAPRNGAPLLAAMKPIAGSIGSLSGAFATANAATSSRRHAVCSVVVGAIVFGVFANCSSRW